LYIGVVPSTKSIVKLISLSSGDAGTSLNTSGNSFAIGISLKLGSSK